MNCYLPWIVILPSLGGEGLCSAVLNGPYPPAPLAFSTYLAAFLMTFTVEAIVVAAWLRHRAPRLIAAVLAANLVTHPATVYLWIPFAAGRDFSTRQILLSAELTIPIIEALVYRACGYRALGASLAANFTSWTVVAALS